ncbi:MAG: hypothetical protein OXQ94_15475 [Gemmatimonadota bacterium]|nr:hypothetical protein [Gemmatimonadota bacterium]MDE2873077.1 hypothetical protein [Gemmatimonadota bacterium]
MTSPLAQFTSLPRRSPLAVAATLLIACEGGAPVACGDIPEQRLFVRQTSELQPCFEDPQGEELILSAISSDPEIATVLVYGSKTVIKGESVGSATITVTAWDPGGLTASTDIGVVVPNRTPVASGTLPPARVLGSGKWLARVDGSFEDPDGHELTFSAASANTALATAGIVDSVTLLVSGVSRGTTTVTVSATDPWGLTGTQAVEVEVVEPVLLFRDDFDSSASLDDWTNLGAVSRSVNDGRLRLWGDIYRDASAAEWEFKAAMGNGGDSVHTGLVALNTGSPEFYMFQIGSYRSNQLNYHLSTCCPWATELDWQGKSDAIAAVGELTEVTLAAVGGRLTAVAGSTLLVAVDLAARDWPDRIQSARLNVRRQDARIPVYGFYDWVELNAVEVDADAGPEWHAGPPG